MTRVLPSFARKRSVNSAVPSDHVAHRAVGGAGAASDALRAIFMSPRPTKRSRKAASPATTLTKPKLSSPGDHETSARHLATVTARRSKKKSHPNVQASGVNSESHPIEALNARATNAVAGDDRSTSDTQVADVIATIRELWRRRQSWHRAEKSLTLQAKAICRRYVGGDKDEADKLFATVEGHTQFDPHVRNATVTVAILPLMMARETVESHRAAVEKELVKLAQQLPVFEWADGIRGFGTLSLAALYGECGDISSYKSASAVWKRMGLAVIDGERQRRVAGADALLHGYSPQRRSVAWNIGVSLMRSQKPGESYRDFYDTEKAKQLAKGLTKGHAHNRACRHMTKRLLAELYGAARKAA